MVERMHEMPIPKEFAKEQCNWTQTEASASIRKP